MTLRSSTSLKGVLFQIRKQGTSQIVDGAFENFDKNLYKLMNCPPGVKVGKNLLKYVAPMFTNQNLVIVNIESWSFKREVFSLGA